MASLTMTPSANDLLFPEQRNPVVLRALRCNVDNCYRALFPCPSPWVVTEAVSYCATVSANSASNYPTQAIAECGTEKERYISACSCIATNCPVGTTSQTTTTTSHIVTPPVSVTTTTAVEEDPSKVTAAAIVTPHQAPATETVTAPDGGAVSTQTTNDGAGGSDPKPIIGLANEPITTDLPATKNTPLGHVPSTDSQTVNQGESVTGSQSSPSSPSPHSLLSPSITTPLGQSSDPELSTPFPLLSGSVSKTKSAALSRVSPPTTISLLVPVSPSTLNEGHGGLNGGLVTLIAVGTTLIALLLLGAAAYCCLKRREARRSDRLRTLTLSRESMPSLGFEVPSEWKPPVELPHQNAVVSRPELQDIFLFRSSDSASQSAPVTPSSLSANSPFTPRDAPETQGASLYPPPAELFVMPAELPAVYET